MLLISQHTKSGRRERIRTSDPFVPNEVRYQAALHADVSHYTLTLWNYNWEKLMENSCLLPRELKFLKKKLSYRCKIIEDKGIAFIAP